MPIPVTCGTCAKRFKAGDKLAGRRVKCPQCQGFIDIPTPRPEPAKQDDFYNLLDEAQQTPVERKCPSCSRPMGINDVLCVGCGYNIRTGTKVQLERPKPPSKVVKKVSLAGQATASFIKGCFLSICLVLVAALVWYGVAVAIYRELGLIAWLLGAVAGAGMHLGYGKHSEMAGITAAFISCLGIFVAKLAIFIHIINDLKRMQLLDPQAVPVSAFFQTCFGVMDGIFILLAVFTAYRVGSGRSDD